MYCVYQRCAWKCGCNLDCAEVEDVCDSSLEWMVVGFTNYSFSFPKKAPPSASERPRNTRLLSLDSNPVTPRQHSGVSIEIAPTSSNQPTTSKIKLLGAWDIPCRPSVPA